MNGKAMTSAPVRSSRPSYRKRPGCPSRCISPRFFFRRETHCGFNSGQLCILRQREWTISRKSMRPIRLPFQDWYWPVENGMPTQEMVPFNLKTQYCLNAHIHMIVGDSMASIAKNTKGNVYLHGPLWFFYARRSGCQERIMAFFTWPERSFGPLQG